MLCDERRGRDMIAQMFDQRRRVEVRSKNDRP